MRIRFLSTIIHGASLLGFTLAASAVEVVVNKVPDRSIFGVEFPGSPAQFYAKADRVIGVSWQEYTTGTFVVSEVVIDLSGSSQQLRIYSTRPVSSDDARQAVSRSGLPAGTSVPTPSMIREAEARAGKSALSAATAIPVKIYPTTTHARTIEYQVSDVEELNRFYQAFRNLWIRVPVPVGVVNSNVPADGKVDTVSQIGGVLFLIKP